jgi:hypothetical protein
MGLEKVTPHRRGKEPGRPMFRSSFFTIVAMLSSIYFVSAALAGTYLSAGIA